MEIFIGKRTLSFLFRPYNFSFQIYSMGKFYLVYASVNLFF